ncbi:MAG: copper-translocating P-type ATPase [Candidatus Ryanbacteria bacterium RIFCSPHIGHO2_02_FULL_45_43]|uniref:Copper-translocating P-type ATPase n=1 Tax=Candidatus Ryanbacteria bacterium RIFCSPHIGHO2_01_45_13 TaxID=1802112 RepID=A0A1G2G036_9BACT|nr:MAG: copper-translocating P-type ATPase [Candidatus Ryanbacteria bacterium RIFCSPHIGHO2_01_FULL_44_130]OGZ43666.1 MAG: copper-translocating P-type ATPase [Candidatus Ryanbacteria bacterium RIFCSPHIGHO2_01_45_13]OGZ49149.1 MAG: copper-translocating P-type ATPase [Candidatus Ryanbacteria bacterium RIFCSPHIGHO2_02_FULL_45_43]OGZ50931.1 MAG: copper-translocating P-type ATPase [Candidatus Ryanbacteria bacterium RIFCSPHIGHO2_12_FULL_44_20]OGZ51410.1 MAG: copper-translocating P-type ATPase [Candida
MSHRNHSSHDKHAGHSTAMFFRKFWTSLVLTIPVVLYADVVEKLFKWSPPAFPGSEYLPLTFGSIVFFYGGWVFLVGAWREIGARLPGMMTLIGIAISTAYLWSLYAVFAGAEALFWELTTLITIMLLGHWLEMRAVSGAQGALKELSKLLPDTADVIRDGKTEKIPLSKLRENDMVLVRPGAKIPADGTIIDGYSDVNESMVTGESKLVPKKQGDTLIAGTINGDGALKVKVSNIGEKTFLAGVMRLVAEAQASKSRLQMLSDRAAFYLTVIAIMGGGVTFVAWLIAGAGVGFAVARLVAVLVIACPHALGLAVPLVASISTTKAAQSGFLVKQRIALEAARTIDIVLFDKTGTLTKGEFGVVGIWNANGHSKDEVLKLAASLDAFSEHPIARAVVTKAKEQGLPLTEPKRFEALKGKGVKAFIEDREIMVGGPALLDSIGITIPKELTKQVQDAGEKGQTIIFALKDRVLLGAIALADIIREESREAVKALKEIGVLVSVITGDSEEVAKWVSDELGIDEYFARVLPHQKSEKVKELQGRGLKVAMVGDGINDAPALTQADIGIAIGAGTNVAIESAGIILVRDDPRDIPKIIRLSRLTYVKMLQNLFWATGYNVIAIPLAAGILAFKGIFLQPALAALFMSLSTVIVAVNAMLLRGRALSQ